MKFKAFRGEKEWDIDVNPVDGGYRVAIDGVEHEIDTAKLEGSFYSLIVGNRSYEVSVTSEDGVDMVVRQGGRKESVKLVDPLAASAGAHLAGSGPAELTAVMPGRVVKVLVEEGQEVAEGQGVIVLEAMKMENEVEAPRAGTVRGVFVQEGQTLDTGAKIAVIE